MVAPTYEHYAYFMNIIAFISLNYSMSIIISVKYMKTVRFRKGWKTCPTSVPRCVRSQSTNATNTIKSSCGGEGLCVCVHAHAHWVSENPWAYSEN